MLLLATSCCDTKVKTIVDYKVIVPPESLLEPCAEVPMDIKTNGDILMALIELRTQYLVCSLKVESLRNYYDTIDSTKL